MFQVFIRRFLFLALRKVLFFFSIFASIAVVANCLLMMSLFPASIILWEKFCKLKFSLLQGRFQLYARRLCCLYYWNFIMTSMRMKIEYLYTTCEKKQNLLLDLIINLRYLWFTFFSVLAFASAFVVFYYPQLQLPNSPEFQLFHSMHPFEQYDLIYKDLFWFKRSQKVYVLPCLWKSIHPLTITFTLYTC